MDSKTLRASIATLQPKKPISVKMDTSVREVIEVMQKHKIGCVCITEKDELVGILTERDVLKKVAGSNLDIDRVKVDDIMTHDPEYLYLDDQVAFALNRMHMGGFRHIPLLDLNGTPVGVISVRDIAAHVVKSMESAA